MDKKDDASFKSKSKDTNDSSSLGETSSANNITRDNEIVNNDASFKSIFERIEKADAKSQVPHSRKTAPWLQTSETPLNLSSASNNNISQDSSIVNNDVTSINEQNIPDIVIILVENIKKRTYRK